jgi:hypothetical protein
MDFKTYKNFNFEKISIEDNTLLENIFSNLSSITSDEVVNEFSSNRNLKSISKPLNSIISDRFIKSNWIPEKPILSSNVNLSLSYSKRWTLDFYKNRIGLEVAFDHNVGIAWNLTKLFMAANENEFEKAIDIKLGVLITADNQLKTKGGFDGSIGTFEQYVEYSKVFESIYKMRILIIGLSAPNDFWIRHRKIGSKKIGKLREY